MSSQPAPTRTLPLEPNLGQLRKQAKEWLRLYRAGNDAAVAEIERFERAPNPLNFALADAQRNYRFAAFPWRGLSAQSSCLSALFLYSVRGMQSSKPQGGVTGAAISSDQHPGLVDRCCHRKGKPPVEIPGSSNPVSATPRP